MKFIKNPALPTFTCFICGASNTDRFVHPATLTRTRGFISPEPICGICFRERATQEGRHLHDEVGDLDTWVAEQLAAVGMSKVEVDARLDQIPQELLANIPDEVLLPMFAGKVPKAHGLGLAGIPGSGKTSALAALVRQLLARHAANLNPFYELVPPRDLLWWNWPTVCHRWRLDALDWRVAWDIKRGMTVGLLVIDDLGRETKRKEPGADVATGHLDAVITHRDREGLITLWTTNDNEADLISYYATGMIRRLLRLNPMVWLEGADFHPNALCPPRSN